MFDIERVRKLINWYIFLDIGKNDAEIAALMEYEKSYFSQIVNGKKPLTKSFVNKLCSLDKNINKVWISGVGSMLKNDHFLSQTTSEMPQSFMKNSVLKKIGIPRLSNEEVLKFPAITEEDDYENEKFYYTPEWDDQGAHFLIQFSGDYMDPTIQSGDIIVCKKTSKEDPICWGKIYLLSLSNRLQVCRVYPDENNEKQYKIVLDNKSVYPHFFWPKNQIKSIFSVIGLMKML